MNDFVYRFLLTSALMQAVYGVYPSPQNVANVFFRPHMASLDTTISIACFSNYIVKSNEVSETFGQDYNQCLLDAKTERQATETEINHKRIAIEKSSQDTCQRLSTCNAQNTTLEIFDCHAKTGANNTKAVYSIAGNASEHANDLQEKYRILVVRHEQCCKTAERKYVKSTAANYRNLQDCLEGGIKPSQTTIPINQPTTTSSTTTAVISSTTDIEPSPAIFETTTSGASDSTLPDSEGFPKMYNLLN